MSTPPKTLNDMVSAMTADQMRAFCQHNGFTIEKLTRMLAEVRRRKYLAVLARSKGVKREHRERVVRRVGGEELAVRRQVDADSYHYWGIRLGYDCWRDKQFLREYERDNPECVVNLIRPTVVSFAGTQ